MGFLEPIAAFQAHRDRYSEIYRTFIVVYMQQHEQQKTKRDTSKVNERFYQQHPDIQESINLIMAYVCDSPEKLVYVFLLCLYLTELFKS